MVKKISLIGGICVALSVLLHIVAYQSLEAPLAGLVFLFFGCLIFHPRSPLGGRNEKEAFFLFFSVCQLWAGLAGLYSFYLDDPSQKGDVLWFFTLSAETGAGLALDEIRNITAGSGAIVIWRSIYDLFASLGFEKGPYIAVAFNALLVSAAGIIGIKTLRLIFDDDLQRIARFVILFSACGIFWLFAAVHLRDGFVLLLNTILMYVWVRYLRNPRLPSAVLILLASAAGLVALLYLRTEFLFLPVALLLAGVSAMLLAGQLSRPSGLLSLSLIMGVVILCIIRMHSAVASSIGLVSGGAEQYGEFARSLDNNGSSLGVTYVINQPMPVRLVVGFLYLHIFPIPFWSGLSEGSIYLLLKACNGVFMWFVVPLASLGVLRSFQAKARIIKTAMLFLIFVYGGMVLAIAGTSLETRHLGAFFVPLLIIATVPDLRLSDDARAYRNLLGSWLAAVALAHAIWAVLKLA